MAHAVEPADQTAGRTRSDRPLSGSAARPVAQSWGSALGRLEPPRRASRMAAILATGAVHDYGGEPRNRWKSVIPDWANRSCPHRRSFAHRLRGPRRGGGSGSCRLLRGEAYAFHPERIIFG